MAPAVIIDNTPDFDTDMGSAVATKSPTSTSRTLLLAPPSLASQPNALTRVAEAHDRDATDIQMLDRLAIGLVALPPTTYDVVLVLSDADQSAQESSQLLSREVMERIVQSLKPGGRLRSQDGSLGSSAGKHQTEAVLAGLQDFGGDGMLKPQAVTQAVNLRFGKKKANAAAVPANAAEAANTSKRKIEDMATGNGGGQNAPVGVGFDDGMGGGLDEGDQFEDDFDFPSNEELQNAGMVDVDTLLTEADKQKPLVIPEACKPNSKRRRACKDCTCGLAERLNAEDTAKRTQADSNLAKLSANDLTEVDFTVQGKVGSCGNCALGDAFRCDGCPYIGLPAFKPGEEVRLLNNDIQL